MLYVLLLLESCWLIFELLLLPSLELLLLSLKFVEFLSFELLLLVIFCSSFDSRLLKSSSSEEGSVFVSPEEGSVSVVSQ